MWPPGALSEGGASRCLLLGGLIGASGTALGLRASPADHPQHPLPPSPPNPCRQAAPGRAAPVPGPARSPADAGPSLVLRQLEESPPGPQESPARRKQAPHGPRGLGEEAHAGAPISSQAAGRTRGRQAVAHPGPLPSRLASWPPPARSQPGPHSCLRAFAPATPFAWSASPDRHPCPLAGGPPPVGHPPSPAWVFPPPAGGHHMCPFTRSPQ